MPPMAMNTTRMAVKSPELTYWEQAVSCHTVLRKTSASIFLVAMSFLIVLHSPVFGYCPEKESFFVGEFECEASLAQDSHDCHCDHEEVPVPSPCDGEHELISLDSADFIWSAMGEFGELEMTSDSGQEIQSQLINRCVDNADCTEAEHALNRRTEIRIFFE